MPEGIITKRLKNLSDAKYISYKTDKGTLQLELTDDRRRVLKLELKSLQEELKKIEIGYVDSWNIRDKEDVHPSHRTAVIELHELLSEEE